MVKDRWDGSSIVFHVGSTAVSIHTSTLYDLLWNNAPRVLTVPTSEERKSADWLDMIPRGIFRKLLAKIVVAVAGDDAPLPNKHDDPYQYAVGLLIGIILAGLTSHEWEFAQVKEAEREQDAGYNQERHYLVCGVSPRPPVPVLTTSGQGGGSGGTGVPGD